MSKNNNRFLLKYAGMATQFLVAIAIAVWGGIRIDQWLGFKTPLAVWLLPLLIITGIIIKIIKDTSTKK
jgi:hypothetical protein